MSIHKKQSARPHPSKQETARLLAIAKRIQAVEAPQLSEATKARIARIAEPRHRTSFYVGWSFAGAFGLFIALVIGAQFSSPSSPLYAIKVGTEQIRALIQPEYKDSLVDVRKDELKVLEESDAAPEQIIEAEDAFLEAIENSSEQKQMTEEETGTIRMRDDSRSEDDSKSNGWYWNKNTRWERYRDSYDGWRR